MRRGTLAPAVVLLALAAYIAAPALAQGGVAPPPVLEVRPTGIYGVGAGSLGDYKASDAAPDYSRGLIYVAGYLGDAGFLAAVSPGGVVWSQSLEGRALAVAVDNEARASLVAAATNLGDLVVVDPDNAGFYAYYYRAMRGSATGLHVLASGKVVATDTAGSLYLFDPPAEGWFEMAPEPGEAAHTYQPGVTVALAAPLTKLNSIQNHTAYDTLFIVAPTVADSLRATLYGFVYYINDTDTPQQAWTGDRQLENGTITETRMLRIWLLDIYYHAPETLSDNSYPIVIGENSTGNYTVEALYPASYLIYVEYEVVRKYTENDTIAGYECYASIGRVDLAPAMILRHDVTVERINASNPMECKLYREQVVGVLPEGAAQIPLLILDARTLPQYYNMPSHLRFTYYPIDTDLRAPVHALWVLEPAQRPLSWIGLGARYLLVAGYGPYAVLILLNDNLEAVPAAAGYTEMVFLGAPLTVVEAAPNLDRIYLGTSDGRVLELTWTPAGGGRYVLTGALVVSPGGEPVTTLRLASQDLLLAGTEDGFAQLVDVDAWRPLWRGPALYQGIDVAGAAGSPGSSVGGLWHIPGVGLMGFIEDTSLLVVPYGSTGLSALYPVYIEVNASLATLQGGTVQLQLPAEATSINVYTGDGDLVASAVPTATEAGGLVALAFLPAGEFTVVVNSTGTPLGTLAVEAPLAVEEGVNHLPLDVRLREVNVTVSTPREGPPAYQLVYGPKPGALVNLTLANVSEGLGYTPLSPLAAGGVTGIDGSVVLVVFDGASYTATASLPEYEAVEATVPEWGPAQVTVQAHPILYQVTITAIDAEVEREAGQAYPVHGATATIALTGTGRSITIQLGQGTATIGLPRAEYEVTVEAPHYHPQQATVEVTGPTTLTLALEPVKYSVAITVEIDDETGILGGPLPGARVTLQINGLPLPPVSAFTGPDGVAVVDLRAGTYTITVTHQVTQSYTGTLTVRGPGEDSVTVQPKYSLVDVRVVDTELAQYGILVKNAVLTIEYTGPAPGGSKTVNIPTGQAEILLPYGYYTISVTAPGYQPVAGIPAAVTGPSSELTIPMAPLRYPVQIVVYFNDEKWSLATGPVPGAVVTVELILPDYPVPPAVLVTGPDGSASFNLRPGVYRVTVEHPLLENYTTTAVVAGPVTYTLLVSPYYINTTIIVVDAETQKPVPGVTLSLTYLSGGEPRRITLALDEGVLTASLPAGVYRIEAAEQHYYTAVVEVPLEGVGEARRVIALQPMYQQVLVQVESGEVRVEEPIRYTIPKAPLANATIRLVPIDPTLAAVGVQGFEAKTGPDGTALVSVRVGAYRVTVEAQHYEAVEARLEVAPGASLRVSYTLTPVLFNTTIIPVDPEMLPGFEEVRGALVAVTSWNDRPISIRYEYGVDASWLLLPAGRYTVTVEARDYEQASAEFTVPAGEPVRVEIRPVLYSVVVEVKLESKYGSSPAAGLNITLTSSLPLKEPSVTATLGTDGTVQLQLRKSNYTVTAQPPGYWEPITIGSFTVEGDVSVTLTVEAPVYNLTVTVVDAEYRFYGVKAVVDLVYMGPYGSGEESVETAPSGTLELQLPAGAYQLVVTAPGYEVSTLTVNMTNHTSITVEMEPIYVGFTIKVTDIDGKPVPGAEVILRHATLPYTERVVAIYVRAEEAAVAKVPGGIRLGNYTLIVIPPEDYYYLEAYTTNITVVGDVSMSVTLNPKTYNVTIVLIDKDTGNPIPFTYIATLKRSGAGSELLHIPAEVNITRQTSILLPYGSYTMTLKAVREDYYVLPPQVNFVVDGNKTVQVPLEPKLFQVVVTVVDDRGQPLSGAMVRIFDVMRGVEAAIGKTDSNGQFIAMLKYGAHQIDVEMEGYKPATRVIDVPTMTSATVELQPGPVVLLKRFAPLIIGVAGIAAVAYILLRVRERIAARLMEEEEYF